MYSLIRRLGTLVATLVVVIAVAGCAESSRPEATGKGNIRGINGIATAPDVRFLIEERDLGGIAFKDSRPYRSWDDLSYNFNFDVFLPAQPVPTRLSTTFIDVQADHEYTVVLTGTMANPSSIFWEDPFREWNDSETVSEIIFAHLAPSMGELDIYFAAPDTIPVLGQAVGSLTEGNRLPGMDFEEDAYSVVLTPKDDPATIIYQSLPVNLTAQTRVLFAIFDIDPSTPGNVAVNFIIDSGQSTGLPDVNFPPEVRTLHATFGIENFDGYFDNDFANLIYPDIEFKELSQYEPVIETTILLTLTPVGNSGAVIHEDDVSVAPDTRRTVVLTGMPGDLSFNFLLDNGRPIETAPLVRFLNASFNTEALDIYILEPGTPIDDDAFALVRSLPTSVDTGFSELPDGMREITATLPGETTPVSESIVLDLANGDVLDIVVVDTVDPNMVELLLFDSQSLP
jgi:hypothetical protein